MRTENVNLLLQLKALDIVLGGHKVLHAVDLDVTSSEIVTLIGPNGSGKTTLVRAALGLIKPYSGAVWRKPDLRIGYVPQKITIDAALPLSVRRFVTLGPNVSAKQASDALLELDITDIAHHPMRSLSGGEMRRVLLARAMARDPELLVLDEPTAGVDVGGQADLYRLIENLRDHHQCAVILVSHDLHLVMASTDRVVCMNGHVCCTGTPQHVSEHPEYLTLFGDHSQAQLALYTHHHNHSHDLHGVAHSHSRSGEEIPATHTPHTEHDHG